MESIPFVSDGPAMMRAKTLRGGGQWSVVGSTNVDNRSFGLNDEVNLCAFDPQSQAVNYRRWLKRPWRERLHGALGGLFERQQ